MVDIKNMAIRAAQCDIFSANLITLLHLKLNLRLD